jgi:hypothetical protein
MGTGPAGQHGLAGVNAPAEFLGLLPKASHCFGADQNPVVIPSLMGVISGELWPLTTQAVDQI